MLKKGIVFHELRKRFFKTRDIVVWVKLASGYRAFLTRQEDSWVICILFIENNCKIKEQGQG